MLNLLHPRLFSEHKDLDVIADFYRLLSPPLLRNFSRHVISGLQFLEVGNYVKRKSPTHIYNIICQRYFDVQ